MRHPLGIGVTRHLLVAVAQNAEGAEFARGDLALALRQYRQA